MADVRAIALDTSSRTSVALTRVLCARLFEIEPRFEPRGPDLDDMLRHCDAALLIGDNALFAQPPAPTPQFALEKIDLGQAWKTLTGLPFVYAFWAGRPGVLTAADVEALQRSRDAGIDRSEDLARVYVGPNPERQAIGARYLRDNIRYYLGEDEQAGLEAFFRYAAEAGVVERMAPPQFY
jgi:chorismate dehydratase